MIFEVITVIVLGRHEPHSHKMANLILKCRGCSDWPATPHEGLKRPAILFRPSFSLRHNSIKIRPSKCSSESKSRTSFTLNQKLEVIMLGEECRSKAEVGWKLGLCHLVSQDVNAKEKSLQEIKSATPVSTQVIKWNSLANVEKGWVAWIEEKTSQKLPLSQSLIQNKALSLFSSTKAERGEEATERKGGN